MSLLCVYIKNFLYIFIDLDIKLRSRDITTIFNFYIPVILYTFTIIYYYYENTHYKDYLYIKKIKSFFIIFS